MRKAFRLGVLALGIVLSGCVRPHDAGYAPGYSYDSGAAPAPAVVVVPVEEKKPRYDHWGGSSWRGYTGTHHGGHNSRHHGGHRHRSWKK